MVVGVSYGAGHTPIGYNQNMNSAQQGMGYDRFGNALGPMNLSQAQAMDRYLSGGGFDNYFGYPSGGRSGGVGRGGGGIHDLLQRQMAENASAKAQNQANWTAARDYLLGQQARYDSNPVVDATRRMVSKLLANPESLDDRTVGQIQNNASSGIIARMNQMQDQGAGILAAGGQSDAASLAALNERIGNAGGAQLAGVSRDVGIQRAQQRRSDELNAIGAGMRQGQMDTGVGMQIAQSYLGGLPQYMPDDYSGLIAAMQQFQGQGGGNGNMPGQFTRTGGMGGRGIGGSGSNSTGAGFEFSEQQRVVDNRGNAETNPTYGRQGYISQQADPFQIFNGQQSPVYNNGTASGLNMGWSRGQNSSGLHNSLGNNWMDAWL